MLIHFVVPLKDIFNIYVLNYKDVSKIHLYNNLKFLKKIAISEKRNK